MLLVSGADVCIPICSLSVSFCGFCILAFMSPVMYIGPLFLYLSIISFSFLYASSFSSSGLSACGMYVLIIVIGIVACSVIYIKMLIYHLPV